MKPEFAAHTPRDAKDPNSPWHDLTEHLEHVATMGAGFATKFGGADIALQAGWMHDAGKCSHTFQSYLLDAFIAKRDGTNPPERGKVDHSSTGAVLAAEWFDPNGTDGSNLELAFVIAAHHGGLDSVGGLEERLRKKQNDDVVEDGINRYFAAYPKIADQLESGTKPTMPHFSHPREREVFVRFLLSSLVDADQLDTESFGSPHKTARRDEYRTGFATPQALLDRLEHNQAGLQTKAESTPLNAARKEIFEACLERALLAPGFFRLSVPTGGGKTRSSLAFALKHAATHGFDRVIYALPFLTIIDQTAKEFRKILGDTDVLEHHSAFNPKPQFDDGVQTGDDWSSLASENWEAPVIVTTTVQLLHSLFARRTSHLRKLHNICRSVIVFDEAQSLPVPLLEPILDMLRELVRAYQVSIVFCTATQPAFEALKVEGITEIIPDPARYYATLERVKYDPLPSERWGWDRVAQEMQASHQALCILNTKKQARALFETLGNQEGAYHLSTNMCGAHRLDILETIRARLKAKQACWVASTQLIEAGVDLDFPRALRAIGPLDSIAQAAGRCNREGTLRDEYGNLTLGRVTVFRPEEAGSPQGVYEVAMKIAQDFLEQGSDFNDPETFKRYFKRLYDHSTTDGKEIQKYRNALDYPKVEELFKLIPDDTQAVLIRTYDAEPVNQILEAFARATQQFTSRKAIKDVFRNLQPYFVNIYAKKFEQLKNDPKGLIRPVTQFVDVGIELYEWSGGYSPQFGVLETTQVESFFF
jgi:CRISPR-associated endonuclease/helicase Cas3